jgi:glycerol-3-phosphate dehydrogenase
MITICGGKWTTYRHMAEDCVNQAATLARLAERPCGTEHLNIHGFHPSSAKFGMLAVYGSDAPSVRGLMDGDPSLAAPLHAALPYTGAEVVWAVRHELARTVEDVLARRTRALFLNAGAALEMSATVAKLMAGELGCGREWEERQIAAFRATAANFILR